MTDSDTPSHPLAELSTGS